MFYSTFARGQGLSEYDVTAVMESPELVASIFQCVADRPHPVSIDLTIIVDTEGNASMKAVSPSLNQEMTACMGRALKKVTFGSTGTAFEITYPFNLSAPAETSAPGPATTRPGPADAAPAEKPEPSFKDFQKEVLKGKGMIAGGAILIVLGAVGAIILPLTGIMSGGCTWEMTDEEREECENDADRRKNILSGVGLGLGIPMLAAGIALVVLGSKKKKKALLGRYDFIMPQPGFTRSCNAGGMITTLTWRF